MSARTSFTRFAWAFVAYLLAVILFGAWVRITHSGAGCGSHWPTCHGEIIPLEPSIETLIEYTHRVTSGLLGIIGLGVVAWAARRFGSHRVTWAAVVTLAFIVFEALIGAGIVLKELVGDDDSVARAVVISLHLVNTLMLMAAAALTAAWSASDSPPHRDRHIPSGARWVLGAALAALIVTSMTGAVTALGDTLFPVEIEGTLLSQVTSELSRTNHFLVRLRVFHPLVALVAAAVLWFAGGWIRRRSAGPRSHRFARAMQHGVVLQVVAGIVNIGLAAPGWMQLIHLLLAQLVWMATVLAADAVASEPNTVSG